jgi:hypothetical protein
MPRRGSLQGIASAAALGFGLSLGVACAGAAAGAEYPDWQAQWRNASGGHFNSAKPRMRQEAPLTAEYQAIYDAGVANAAAGGQGNDPMWRCIPPGMPRAMIVYEGMEIAITPSMTYIAIEVLNQLRRIHTDGHDWPAEIDPSYAGYSIGKWVDEKGEGKYDALLVETRGLKGPRVFDSTGIPLHQDNQTVVKERIYSDKSDPNVLHDDITTIDHALTRPWTVTRSYQRVRDPVWTEQICSENNHHILIGKENYYVSEDGYLMPVRKNQPPPDLRYFNLPQK